VAKLGSKRREVADLLKHHGATFINSYGMFSIEGLGRGTNRARTRLRPSAFADYSCGACLAFPFAEATEDKCEADLERVTTES
jgi:hypothetical protein